MKIAFVYGAYESLALEYLSALLKLKGYTPRLFYHPFLFSDALLERKWLASFFREKQRLLQKITDYRPDILAFSSLTDTYDFDSWIARNVKEKLPGTKILFGGIHATAVPDHLLSQEFIDYVCIGEGDHAMVDFVHKLELGMDLSDTENIWMKHNGGVIKNPLRPLVHDLDSLPFPDKELFLSQVPYFRGTYTVITSRGCLFRCSFCNNNLFHKKYGKHYSGIRRRSVHNVISELSMARKKWKISNIVFEDDMFVSDREWCLEFFREYRKHINLPYQCLSHPAFLSEEIVAGLASSGCRNIEVGVQTIEKKISELFKRPQHTPVIFRNISYLKKYGIPFNIDHIGGAPGESLKMQKKALHAYSRLKPNRVTYFFLTYYPGTEITEKALEQGWVTKQDYEMLINGNGASYEQSGSVDSEEYECLRTVSGLISIIPGSMIRWLLDTGYYRLLRKSYFLAKYLPSLITTLTGKEVRGRMIIKKYIYELSRFWRWM